MSSVSRDPYSGALIYKSSPEEEREYRERQENKNLVKRVNQLENDLYNLKKILIENNIIKV